jgi:hypothetical protein
VSKYEHQLLQNWIKFRPEKKVQSSGGQLEHKTQNTTHSDTTTNKMSHATLPSSGFAPSLSMGRAVAPPNHVPAAPQRHAQAATCQGCACCVFDLYLFFLPVVIFPVVLFGVCILTRIPTVGHTTVPFFQVVIFSSNSWCLYFDTTDGYLRFIPTDG